MCCAVLSFHYLLDLKKSNAYSKTRQDNSFFITPSPLTPPLPPPPKTKPHLHSNARTNPPFPPHPPHPLPHLGYTPPQKCNHLPTTISPNLPNHPPSREETLASIQPDPLYRLQPIAERVLHYLHFHRQKPRARTKHDLYAKN